MSHQIDSLVYTNRLRWLPPGQKLSFAIVLMGLSLMAHPIVQILISVWLVLWIVIYANIPANFYFRLLLLPLGFLLTSLPAVVINGVGLNSIQSVQADVWQGWGMGIGSLYLYVSQTGLHQAGLLFVRVLATTSSTFFILLTTPFSEIVQILRQLRCPAVLVEVMLMMYRFIFTLLAIADELWMAQNSRCGYVTFNRGIKSLGLLVGQLLQRSLLSYRQASLSLASRGFNGELRVWLSYPYQASRRYRLEAIVGCMMLTIFSLALH
ncbi:MAG: cobalt ECF transporter T component CbiQ [Leptolyngbyaceae cyanobacterium SM2_5_2]|nr:cobalt ECF transporter T component CbiQ [Leptolyngbyaceae cyanobacterium SM2_5_2]